MQGIDGEGRLMTNFAKQLFWSGNGSGGGGWFRMQF